MLSKKTIVLSGASGFIGSHVHKYMSALGWNVLTAGRNKDSDIHFDLGRPSDFSNKLLDIEVDAFVHVAAAHEVVCNEFPYDAVSFNVLGTKAALDFSVKNTIPLFIYISTFHVYGKPHDNICEDDVPLPANDYGLSHYVAEQYVEMYQRNKLLKCTCLRPTNVYGVPVDIENFNRWSLIPYAFCKQAVEKRIIELNTTGEQKRNFVSVLDVCGVIVELVKSEAVDSVVHIYGDELLTIAEFAELVKKVMWNDYSISISVSFGKDKMISNEFNFMSNCLDKYMKNKSSDSVEKFVSEFCGILLSYK